MENIIPNRISPSSENPEVQEFFDELAQRELPAVPPPMSPESRRFFANMLFGGLSDSELAEARGKFDESIEKTNTVLERNRLRDRAIPT